MTVVGIIAEYNPLHLGHKHHLKCAKEAANANACVCVLSSNFVQRGEPALISKWARTKMALISGADLVIELPSAFSCGSAEYFSSGAVSILDSLGIVDFLCFGSEAGSLDALETAAQHLAFENDFFKENLKKGLEKGLSFAVSRQKALELTLSDSQEAIDVITKPNNILGIEYIKALLRTESTIKPITIERKGQGYNSLELAKTLSSATAIRHYIQEMTNLSACNKDAFLLNNMPEACLEILSEEINSGRGPIFSKRFENIILHLFRNKSEVEISQLPYMEDGLENRLKKAALNSVTFEDLVAKVVTKRYPASRIKRILFSAITGITGEFIEALKLKGYAQYIRVLGFNEVGRSLLSDMRKKARLPIIIKPSSYEKLDNTLARELFRYEIRATDAYVLGYPSVKERIGSSEFSTSPIYI